MISPHSALQRLRHGNQRFVSGKSQSSSSDIAQQRREVASGQQPWAIIVGCSDSRVPVEAIFDQGLGDLFTIRVAGNIVGPSQIGSVEFAASQFGTRLVVVLGHSGCGAVVATLQELRQPGSVDSDNLLAIIDRVRPTVESLLTESSDAGPKTLLEQAVRAHVRACADQLRRESRILDELVRSDGLRIVSAEYSLETGRVEFFDSDV